MTVKVRPRSPEVKSVPCKCPRCEKTHQKKIWYTGIEKFPLRKYCDQCQSYVERNA